LARFSYSSIKFCDHKYLYVLPLEKFLCNPQLGARELTAVRFFPCLSYAVELCFREKRGFEHTAVVLLDPKLGAGSHGNTKKNLIFQGKS
jgi:hypothetical protein